ncbi:hypothetical protein PFISCL1PPCAC_16073, partial [Pristionchus fissidentatus]
VSGTPPAKSAKNRNYAATDYAVFAILFFTNILNYMDRYTMAGVLTGIQKDFSISDSLAGLLQTTFIVSLAVGSPVFGYLGDRYSRKWLMVVGLLVWTLSVLGSSLMPQTKFGGFVSMRGLFGIGQAAYVTVSPSLIADIFAGSKRSTMLMLYYFGIPVGSGLGFIVGSQVASVTGDWRWGIRATTILDAICLVLIIIFVKERPRGITEHEGAVPEKQEKSVQHSSYGADLLSLFKNATFMTSSFAYTCVIFVTGTLSWWMPTAMQHIYAHRKNFNSTDFLPPAEKSTTTFNFGIITLISGFVGVAAGSVLSSLLSSGKWCFACCQTPRSDPIICAVGTAIGVPTFFAVMQLVPMNMVSAQVVMFFCISSLCFIWATNVNLLISVVPADKRNSANGIQILLSHIFGDGSGPYVIGAISDAIRGTDRTPLAHWKSLSLAFYVANAILIPAVVLFIVAAITYPRDRANFLKAMNGSPTQMAAIAENGNSTSNKVAPVDTGPNKNAFQTQPTPQSSDPQSSNEKTAAQEK